MKPNEIDKIKILDPTECNGTIMNVLMDPNINQASYPDVLYHLLNKTLDERAYYEKMHMKFFSVITAAGLMTNELLGLGEKL